MKKILEVIGWMSLLGFTGCLIWTSVSTKFTHDQYVATTFAAVAMGIMGTICLIVSTKKTLVRKDFI